MKSTQERDYEHFKVYEEESRKDSDDVHHQDHRVKKLVVGLGGLFLVLLMLSFVVVTYPIGDIIKGIMQSNPIEENRLNLDSLSIVFSDIALDSIQGIYLENQKVEFSACLLGEKAGREYYVDSVYLPIMYEQRFDHVSFEPCSDETLIMLHSHPYKSCVASETDIETLNSMKGRNPDVLMVVMCEPERFSVYG